MVTIEVKCAALHLRRARSRAGSHPAGTPVAIRRATGCASHPLSLEAREGKELPKTACSTNGSECYGLRPPQAHRRHGMPRRRRTAGHMRADASSPQGGRAALVFERRLIISCLSSYKSGETNSTFMESI